MTTLTITIDVGDVNPMQYEAIDIAEEIIDTYNQAAEADGHTEVETVMAWWSDPRAGIAIDNEPVSLNRGVIVHNAAVSEGDYVGIAVNTP